MTAAFTLIRKRRLTVSDKKIKTEPCHECEGTGWFSPTGIRNNGWSCRCCGGTGKLPEGTYQALKESYAAQSTTTPTPPPASLPDRV